MSGQTDKLTQALALLARFAADDYEYLQVYYFNDDWAGYSCCLCEHSQSKEEPFPFKHTDDCPYVQARHLLGLHVASE